MDIYDKILEAYLKTENSPRTREIELLRILIKFIRNLQGASIKDEVAGVIIFLLSLLNECHLYERARAKEELQENEKNLLAALLQQELSNN